MRTLLYQTNCNNKCVGISPEHKSSVSKKQQVLFKASLDEDTFTKSSGLPGSREQSLPIDKDSVLDRVFTILKLKKSKSKNTDKTNEETESDSDKKKKSSQVI